MSDKYNFNIFPLFSDVVTTTTLKCDDKKILKSLKKLKYVKREGSISKEVNCLISKNYRQNLKLIQIVINTLTLG
mgnify:CR=1 FL=1